MTLSLGSSSSATRFFKRLCYQVYLAFYPLMQDPISEIANGI